MLVPWIQVLFLQSQETQERHCFLGKLLLPYLKYSWLSVCRLFGRHEVLRLNDLFRLAPLLNVYFLLHSYFVFYLQIQPFTDVSSLNHSRCPGTPFPLLAKELLSRSLRSYQSVLWGPQRLPGQDAC